MCEEYLYDKNIYFDIHTSKLNLFKGEKTLFFMKNVEDVKGNAGQNGEFTITNIRIMWWSKDNPSINLSIGLGTTFHFEQKINNKSYSTLFRAKLLQGQQQRYEFNFACESKQLYETLINIQKLYNNANLFREIKVQFAMINKGQLILQNNEQIINIYQNTISVSNDQMNMPGKLIFTNIRFVWFSLTNEMFNISIPWISVKKLSKKSTKGQQTIVVETHFEFGGYFVGYRVPEIDILFKEFQKLQSFYSENPIYGIQLQEKQPIQQIQFNEQIKIIDSIYNQSNKYEVQQGDNNQLDIIVSPELGLAIEKLPQGTTLSDLWNILKI